LRQLLKLQQKVKIPLSTQYNTPEWYLHRFFPHFFASDPLKFKPSLQINMTVRTISSLPELPVVSLQTAESKNTVDAFRGKNTVIGKFCISIFFAESDCIIHHSKLTFSLTDFWTTKCTRCPDALDRLEEMAQDPKYQHVQFVSICCDKLDGAREIIEQEDELRWNHLQHYFMESQHKEQAKQILGFSSVPFYVMLNEDGEITQKGSKVDFDDVPGVLRPQLDKENVDPVLAARVKELVSQPVERVFELDDLDF
jgi:thiol-disulfide isomerase/thioredoxin